MAHITAYLHAHEKRDGCWRAELRAELIPELVKVNRQIEENKALLDQPLRTIGSSAAASPKAEQSDAELMVDLGISFDGKWYRFGEYGKYHCDNLADAIRRVRQIR